MSVIVLYNYSDTVSTLVYICIFKNGLRRFLPVPSFAEDTAEEGGYACRRKRAEKQGVSLMPTCVRGEKRAYQGLFTVLFVLAVSVLRRISAGFIGALFGSFIRRLRCFVTVPVLAGSGFRGFFFAARQRKGSGKLTVINGNPQRMLSERKRLGKGVLKGQHRAAFG